MPAMRDILANSPIIPVLTLEKVEHAVPVAKALLAGGISTIEIALRNQRSYECISAILQDVPKMTVAATTVLHHSQLEQVAKLGAHYAATPGFVPSMAEQAAELNLPYLPGVSTISEIMWAQEMDLDVLKLFPAELVGGYGFLKIVKTIFPELQFCASGEIHYNNFSNYLSLSNVLSVAGTWIAKKSIIESENWGLVTEFAELAMQHQLMLGN